MVVVVVMLLPPLKHTVAKHNKNKKLWPTKVVVVEVVIWRT